MNRRRFKLDQYILPIIFDNNYNYLALPRDVYEFYVKYSEKCAGKIYKDYLVKNYVDYSVILDGITNSEWKSISPVIIKIPADMFTYLKHIYKYIFNELLNYYTYRVYKIIKNIDSSNYKIEVIARDIVTHDRAKEIIDEQVLELTEDGYKEQQVGSVFAQKKKYIKDDYEIMFTVWHSRMNY